MSTPTLDRQLSASVPEGFTPIKPNPLTRLWRWIRNHVIAICAASRRTQTWWRMPSGAVTSAAGSPLAMAASTRVPATRHLERVGIVEYVT